ncbi:C4-type zinc ribbon domain-containing protein [Labilibaculum sp. DW002]|uniref:C4-type zinc ribbon domain-containing protein n=1 Tax=Paralabilibaculum antarcticum TaxID=2912572 RepID=A0ABT5VUN2_9BACT|nr:C4-type zinc ribbon domain-containing protein [Labilibaculum sp. DW002]MDE5417989.1 C4-type zinc ribbon domain-containing protein [Labilibaculum sp. DW002]
MTTQNPKAADLKDISVEEKLRALYEMQSIDAEVDRIKTLRGELPLEVQDLEDEIVGLDTRINNLNTEVSDLGDTIAKKKQEIKEADLLIKKYEAQQSNVRNNREFDSISKEIEFQKLEIELCEKRIREFNSEITNKKALIENSDKVFADKQADLEGKKGELEAIVSETKIEEEKLMSQSENFKGKIEERLLTAYTRIRSNARNGLSVVTVERDACGGCFNKIPPQRQMDIRSRKKVIVCEYCGRILVDKYIVDYDHSIEEADKAAAAAKPKRRTRKKE